MPDSVQPYTTLEEFDHDILPVQSWLGLRIADPFAWPAFQRLVATARASLAAKAEEGTTPSEAVYAFAGWLTSRDEPITFSSRHDAGEPARLVEAFCKSQGFADPRHEYTKLLKPYP